MYVVTGSKFGQYYVNYYFIWLKYHHILFHNQYNLKYPHGCTHNMEIMESNKNKY